MENNEYWCFWCGCLYNPKTNIIICRTSLYVTEVMMQNKSKNNEKQELITKNEADKIKTLYRDFCGSINYKDADFIDYIDYYTENE
jgi:hypothetical protein